MRRPAALRAALLLASACLCAAAGAPGGGGFAIPKKAPLPGTKLLPGGKKFKQPGRVRPSC
jgi:hypothetical protein